MRACQPTEDGFVERDGVKLHYEVFGAGEPTVLLLPTWSIIHSRHWKLQVPNLARRHRVVTFDGSGHAPHVRDPVRFNLLLREFIASLGPPAARPASRRWTRALARRRPRALYISSPIGLGHARRDVAIAKQLRALRPELEIDWLAQDPVTRVLETEGERVHPASALLAGESAHIESEATGHDLHAFQAIRRMDEILLSNFMVFHDAVADGDYDLVVGDEAWDVDRLLHENPELKRTAFTWMTDFVGPARAWRYGRSSPTCTGTWRPATSRWSRAAWRPAWS